VPLGMKRTTFFPDADDLVAVGGAPPGERRMDRNAPHLAAKPLRLALVSGGLYSSAGDLGRFCQMVLDRGEVDQRVVLMEPTWRMYTDRAFKDQTYGFGWHVKRNGERETRRLSHTGALSAYRSLMMIDVEAGAFVVALWTLAETGGDGEEVGVSQELKETWLEIMEHHTD
jgi:CubicO group peptidase (beta-lactamase class C family)